MSDKNETDIDPVPGAHEAEKAREHFKKLPPSESATDAEKARHELREDDKRTDE